MPSARLFRSRWSALLWAAGIIWMAVDVADSAPTAKPATNGAAPAPKDADGDAFNAADVASILNDFGS
ncbi:hypothetical protein [Sphingomonas oligophenolica]|nr:hypothetical protein [Sphingomonas oligophenolica]